MAIRKRTTASLSTQAMDMAIAVPQVIAHRMARMAMAGAAPSARDRREFRRMGTEKMSAMVESWNAMAAQTMRANQELATSFARAMWSPWLGAAPVGASLPLGWPALSILGAGMKPIHGRAMANARRLGRTARR